MIPSRRVWRPQDGAATAVAPRGVLACDPGARRLALAYALDGRLVQAGIDSYPPEGSVVDLLVLEKPRNYARFSVAHGDLDRLRDRLAELRARYPKAAVVQYFPSQWKGNVPKEVHHPRTWRVLDENERRLVCGPDDPGYDHNVLDAVSLLLFELRRTKRGGA